MNRLPTHYTIAAYCEELKRKKITVNKEYQRSDEVWPDAARSFLIETVFKNFPIPTMYLHQKTDLKTKTTTSEIVDGQQRSVALRDFVEDGFALGTVLEDTTLHGKKFSGLEDEQKQQILEYQLDVDLFTSASSAEVVEVFRRMNSYTVPLNPEEKRHAQFQGKFKWFINRTAESLSVLLTGLGICSKQQLVRMQDTKLLTDLCYSFQYGIKTTKSKELDSMYKDNNQAFAHEGAFFQRFQESFDVLRQIDGIPSTRLMKPHMVYSLIQAITHHEEPVPLFEEYFISPKTKVVDLTRISRNLLTLDASLKKRHPGIFGAFAEASKSKTNVADNRITRFRWFCRALTEDFNE